MTSPHSHQHLLDLECGLTFALPEYYLATEYFYILVAKSFNSCLITYGGAMDEKKKLKITRTQSVQFYQQVKLLTYSLQETTTETLVVKMRNTNESVD